MVCSCLPVTAGSIVLAYNLPGVENLKLMRNAYVGIFLGKIKKWNDKAIADANPGVKLPYQDITVVTRIGGSGTTYVFTKHLSAISEEFAKGPRRQHAAEVAGGHQGQGQRRCRHVDQLDPRVDRLS